MTWVLSAVGLALVGGDGQCFPQILIDILFRRKNSCFELIGGAGGGLSHQSSDCGSVQTFLLGARG